MPCQKLEMFYPDFPPLSEEEVAFHSEMSDIQQPMEVNNQYQPVVNLSLSHEDTSEEGSLTYWKDVKPGSNRIVLNVELQDMSRGGVLLEHKVPIRLSLHYSDNKQPVDHQSILLIEGPGTTKTDTKIRITECSKLHQGRLFCLGISFSEWIGELPPPFGTPPAIYTRDIMVKSKKRKKAHSIVQNEQKIPALGEDSQFLFHSLQAADDWYQNANHSLQQMMSNDNQIPVEHARQRLMEMDKIIAEVVDPLLSHIQQMKEKNYILRQVVSQRLGLPAAAQQQRKTQLQGGGTVATRGLVPSLSGSVRYSPKRSSRSSSPKRA